VSAKKNVRSRKSQTPQRKRRAAKGLKQAEAKGLVPPQVTTAPEHTGPGRPTDYRAEYCEMLVEHCRGGLTIGSFAGLIDVNRDTLYQWAKAHPEFSDAMGRAISAQQLALEQGLRGQRYAHDVSWRLRTLANVAPKDWREKTDVGLGGIPGAPPIEVKRDKESAMELYMEAIAVAGRAVRMPERETDSTKPTDEGSR